MSVPEFAVAADPIFLGAIIERCIGDSRSGDSPFGARPGREDSSDFVSRSWILVVEDDRDCRDSLDLLLRTSGFLVKTAVNGRQALEVLRELPVPAVILLDNLMPTMTGEEFLEERKTDPRLAEIPVVMLSAWGNSVAGTPLEVDRYVQKPYDPERLLSLVRGFLPH